MLHTKFNKNLIVGHKCNVPSEVNKQFFSNLSNQVISNILSKKNNNNIFRNIMQKVKRNKSLPTVMKDDKGESIDWYVLSWSAKWLYDDKVMSDVVTPSEAKDRIIAKTKKKMANK